LPTLCCVVCGTARLSRTWRNTTNATNTSYQIFLCHNCGLEFSEPMKGGGYEWYSHCLLYKSNSVSPCYRWEYDCFLAAQLQGKMLLDIGCGAGDFALLAEKHGYHVSGVDLQDRSLTCARDRVPSGTFSKLDIDHEPLSGGPFDIITAFEVLEHLERPGAAIAKMLGVLAPEGHIILSVPCIDRHPFFRRLSLIDYPPHHLTMWTAQALTVLLEAAGLDVVLLKRKPFDVGDFQTLAADCLSLSSSLSKRLLRIACRLLEPALRKWPKSGGCSLFVTASRRMATAQHPPHLVVGGLHV
jgi:2-polyprenyl-3-methyl-5-hydroxy-6-metoxy-1,4-benzoquinol methylase